MVRFLLLATLATVTSGFAPTYVKTPTQVSLSELHVGAVFNEEEVTNDPLRQFVKDLLRVFVREDHGFTPAGYAGDIGYGPTTAYKALPPKPWKAPVVEESINAKKRETNQLVKDATRVFMNEDHGFMPTGFSGDIGYGPTTAYKALPPKPWKAPVVEESVKRETNQLVKDATRVFMHEEHGFKPSGFSGDIGNGSMTAYDVLPPKPWKPTN